MKIERLALALTVVNVVLLVAAVAQIRRTSSAASPVVRTRALELVDDDGQVRSRLNVEPDGEVVFRLLDSSGTIRVKLGADESGSGLLLLDETTEPGVHIVARRAATAERPATTSVKLSGADGRQRAIAP